ncbi:MAG: hypothetical protein M1275_03220 [Patescibacteria group bacterium]|nr:hypothetical protein [Patescibacteria group bacterium]
MIKNFVLFTASGEGLPVALQAQREGFDVTVGMVQDWRDTLTDEELKKLNGRAEKPIDHERRLSVYDGILKKYPIQRVVDALKKVPVEKRAEYFIYNDMNYTWKFAEQIMSLGFPGNFPTQFDRKLEADRELAKNFVKQHYPDISVAEVAEFAKVEEGIAFLQDTEDVWALKGNDSDSETVVPKTNDPFKASGQLITALENDRKNYEKAGFILERKVMNPVELTPMICFYNGQPVFTDMDIELKRKGAGDCGRMIGCSANLVFPTDMEARINKIAFPPKVFEMAKERPGMFVIDCSLLYDPETDECYFGEFCTRLGYDSFFTELELAGGVRKFIESVVEGKSPFDVATGKYGMAVRFLNEEPDDEVPAKFMPGLEAEVDDNISGHVWLFDVKKEGDKIVSVGLGVDLAVITASGDTIADATERVFAYFREGFSFKNIIYRPAHDILSYAYSGSIGNRHDYATMHGLLMPDMEMPAGETVAHGIQ